MNLLKWFRRPSKAEKEYSKGIQEFKYSFYDLYTPELLEWIANTNDPILLACASHLINCWEWPEYLPKPKPEYDFVGHGWHGKTRDYKSIVFTQNLMDVLKNKAEVLSPGLSQNLWMTNYFKRYSKEAANQ